MSLDPAAFEAEFPGTSASAAECTVALVRTAQAFLALTNRALGRHDLSVTGREVLAVLEGAGRPLPAGEVAARVLVTTASMTTVLDTLERRGLVTRTHDSGDRRRVLIDITADGRRLVDRFLPEMAAVQTAACLPLDEGQRERLLELLELLDASVRSVDPDAAVRDAPRRRRPRGRMPA